MVSSFRPSVLLNSYVNYIAFLRIVLHNILDHEFYRRRICCTRLVVLARGPTKYEQYFQSNVSTMFHGLHEYFDFWLVSQAMVPFLLKCTVITLLFVIRMPRYGNLFGLAFQTRFRTSDDAIRSTMSSSFGYF